MSRFAAIALALTSFAVSSTAHAHETIPADWCPSGQSPVVMTTFNLSPPWLRAYRAEHETRVKEECGARTCGIIDEWFWAQEAATNHCSASGLTSTTPMDAIPFVSSPLTFNLGEHHELYRFDNGPLVGQCVVCVSPDTPVPMPLPSPTPDDE